MQMLGTWHKVHLRLMNLNLMMALEGSWDIGIHSLVELLLVWPKKHTDTKLLSKICLFSFDMGN